MRFYISILIAGFMAGALSMYMAQRCDIEAAMKPLYYVISELGGKCK